MFNFLDELGDTYTWPVAFNIPANGGKVTAIKFHAEFKRLSKEDRAALESEFGSRANKVLQHAKKIVDGEAAHSADDDTMNRINEALLDEILVGIGEEDKAGNYTAADSDKAARLLGLQGATEAILLAYGKSKSGEKAKN